MMTPDTTSTWVGLGSSSKTTNASGAEIASRTYYAYGSTRSSSGNLQTDRTFTGQKVDETGLMFFEARYYDPALGTFISPDTLVPEPGRAVDYNRFAFVRGNPLKYSDPSGHIPANEICNTFGICGEDAYQQFLDKYGESLTQLLFDTDVTWGHMLTWGDNTAMLVLMSLDESNHNYIPGLWGVSGDVRGKPVYFSQLDISESYQSRDAYLTTQGSLITSVWDLPIDENFRSSYYPNHYVDVSEIWWGSSLGSGGASLLAKNAPKFLKWIPPILTGLDLAGRAGDLVEDLGIDMGTVGYYWDRSLGQAFVAYPVMRYSSTGSPAPNSLHVVGPHNRVDR